MNNLLLNILLEYGIGNTKLSCRFVWNIRIFLKPFFSWLQLCHVRRWLRTNSQLLSADVGVTNTFLVRGVGGGARQPLLVQRACFTRKCCLILYTDRNVPHLGARGWFMRLRPSDETFCRRDILTHVSDGPYSQPCKLPTPRLHPPLSSCSSEWTAKRRLVQVEVAHIHPLVKFEFIDQTVSTS